MNGRDRLNWLEGARFARAPTGDRPVSALWDEWAPALLSSSERTNRPEIIKGVDEGKIS
jgi:hypothetical protein